LKSFNFRRLISNRYDSHRSGAASQPVPRLPCHKATIIGLNHYFMLSFIVSGGDILDARCGSTKYTCAAFLMILLLLLQIAIASLSPQRLPGSISGTGGNTYIRVMDICNDNTMTDREIRFARSRLDAFFARAAASVIAAGCHHDLMIDASDHGISFGIWNLLIGRVLQAASKSEMVSRE
jgi:hypothetical protein